MKPLYERYNPTTDSTKTITLMRNLCVAIRSAITKVVFKVVFIPYARLDPILQLKSTGGVLKNGDKAKKRCKNGEK